MCEVPNSCERKVCSKNRREVACQQSSRGKANVDTLWCVSNVKMQELAII